MNYRENASPSFEVAKLGKLTAISAIIEDISDYKTYNKGLPCLLNIQIFQLIDLYNSSAPSTHRVRW